MTVPFARACCLGMATLCALTAAVVWAREKASSSTPFSLALAQRTAALLAQASKEHHDDPTLKGLD